MQTFELLDQKKEMVLAVLFYACINVFFLYTLDIVKLVSYQMQWTKIDIVVKVRNAISEPLLYKSFYIDMDVVLH